MSEALLDIFEIERFAIHDGPGIRTTVFFQGCPLRCAWCANPESQTIGRHMMFFPKMCSGCGTCAQSCPRSAISISMDKAACDREKCVSCGTCADACPNSAIKVSGKHISCDDLFDIVSRDLDYYRSTNGGVTLSGGEALLHIRKLIPFLERCRQQDISVAVETCGHVSIELITTALDYVDLFLFDLKSLDPERFARFTGGKLETVLDAFEAVAAHASERLIARVPVIPGFNENHIVDIMSYAASHDVKNVHLLPYHTLGMAKYEQLGRECPYPVHEGMVPDLLQPFAAIGADLGLTIKIGG